jgi:hypothetical protein
MGAGSQLEGFDPQLVGNEPLLVGADPQLVGAEDWLEWTYTFSPANITIKVTVFKYLQIFRIALQR